MTDGIGEMHRVLQEKYGEDVNIIDVNESGNSLSISFGALVSGETLDVLGRAIGAGVAGKVEQTVTDEAVWAPYRMR